MARTSRYLQEVRERAVRMVFEHRDEYAAEWEAICSIAEKFGYSAATLRKWLRRMEIDASCRESLTRNERARIKELERENRELRRANEIPTQLRMLCSDGSNCSASSAGLCQIQGTRWGARRYLDRTRLKEAELSASQQLADVG